MSNLDTAPAESDCPAVGRGASPDPVTLAPREVPLGGPRAMSVRRTLPHRDIRTIGAWCFIDDYGPTAAGDRTMAVPPHPHTGLQTITWLLAGDVQHRDSTGGAAVVRPGELNIMTSGWGIAHSEYAVGDAPLRGVQTWVALPDDARHTTPGFAHHDDLPVLTLPSTSGAEVAATVLVGSFVGATSPAQVFSPLVGVELHSSGATEVVLDLDPGFEYGILALDCDLVSDDVHVPNGALRYLGWGADTLRLASDGPLTTLLFGGEPLAEELVMWWNFVGRSHDDIAAARAAWEAGGSRFGIVVDDPADPLPAPALPTTRLLPRPGRR